jgi:hypothetical protein
MTDVTKIDYRSLRMLGTAHLRSNLENLEAVLAEGEKVDMQLVRETRLELQRRRDYPQFRAPTRF